MLKVSIFFVNTPQRTKQPNRVAFFVRWGRHPLIESGSARPSGAAESGSHIRPKSVGELAHQRRGRDIFAKGEIPEIAHKENHALPPQAAESGSHSPLLCSGRPMVAPTVDVERANIRQRRNSGNGARKESDSHSHIRS